MNTIKPRIKFTLTRESLCSSKNYRLSFTVTIPSENIAKFCYSNLIVGKWHARK